MSVNKVRFGIVGTGTIAHRFAEAIKNVPEAELVAVASRTSENAENVNDVTVSSEETETEVNEEAEIVSEIEDMRTEYTKYFRMSDGSYMAAQYAQPVHYEENGEWKEWKMKRMENTASRLSWVL